MHPRNPYDKPIDFVALSCGYLPLKSFLNPKTRMIDFQDARAQRALTKAILKTDFSLELEVPEDRLCPPVPNRLNYVLWVEDIVKAMCQGLRLVKASPSSSGDIALDEAQLGVHGLDIGTGSSAIYPLLACVRNPSWSILATELDEQSFTYAERNIHANDFSSRITLHRASSYLFGPLFADPSLRISFTMCNPPFYASVSEISASKAAKDEDALSTCTGGDREMVYAPSPTTLPARPPPAAKRSEEYETAYAKAIREGGEIAFLARMVDESLYLRERGGWYTSMLGKMRSVPDVVGLIKLAGIDNYAITQFTQGQTRRWAVGWSFSSLRLPDDVSRMSYLPSTHALYKVQPSRTTLDRPIAYPRTLAPTASTPQEALASLVDRVLQSIAKEGSGSIEIERLNDGEVGEDEREEEEEEEEKWVVRAKENTWSRAARRKRKRGALDAAGKGDEGMGEGSGKKVRRARDGEEGVVIGRSGALGGEGKAIEVPGGTVGSWKMVCLLTLLRPSSRDGGEDVWRVRGRWVYGPQDAREMWEGFVGHVVGRIEAEVGQMGA